MQYNWNKQYLALYDQTLDTLRQAGIEQDFAEVLATERCVLTALRKSGAIDYARCDNVIAADHPNDVTGTVIKFPAPVLS